MSDLKKYISKRKERDSKFSDGFDDGYQAFKIGAVLRQARESSGMTQEQLAEKLHTKKSAISRIENHAEDIRLSTLEKFAQVLGRKLEVSIK
ncbi:MAG: helix-turn-helix domain-containing protein [Gammaproteobacteria bacterium]|nr:helix-turn-helix domain-containing protein [Gammaproteobacteria bacterium]